MHNGVKGLRVSLLPERDSSVRNRVGLFDAMPAFWKQMSCENRHAAVAIIDGRVSKAKTNEENSCPWRIENILKVLKYVALDDMLQFQHQK